MSLNQSNVTTNFSTSDFSLENAHGKLDFQMTNDYMFRAVFQSSPKALKGLIAAVLHLNVNDIIRVKILNPIIVGESISNKEFRLDINVLMNDNTLINLEMQVANQFNWSNRSLSYLCRSYDQLEHGDDYNDAKPVIHIGFLDYTLFPKKPEFCALYKFMNTKNHNVFNDNLALYVIDLSKIELATEEDKQYGINHWASLFKATTWEEIRNMSTIDEYLEEATQEMRKLCANDEVRKRCRDRLEYYQDMKLQEKMVEKYKGEVVELEGNIAKLKGDVAELEADNASKDKYIQQLLQKIEELKKR